MKIPKISVPQHGTTTPNAFSRYSLLGSAEELEKWLADRHPILGLLLLLGEAAVWYAKYNTGKTLLMLWLLIHAVATKRISGPDVILVNADDSAHGLVEKLRLTEEYGIHVVAPGHNGFTMNDLVSTMNKMIETDTARGRLIIVDTLKRAVDVMDKKKLRAFTEIVRAFTMKGGSFLALAHTNKNTGPDGKPVPEGAGDILNDFDTGYLLDGVGEAKEGGERIVEFRCVKSRGQVAQRVCYSYNPDPSLSYVDRLSSVQEIDPEDPAYACALDQASGDKDVIGAIEMSIKFGSGMKMDTVHEVADETGESQRTVMSVLDRLTGDDPVVHRWNFKRGEHGRMNYYLLQRPAGDRPRTG